MQKKYNLAIGLTTSRSTYNCKRLLKSLSNIRGDILPVITCHNIDDVTDMYRWLTENPMNCVLLSSDKNIRYFCQSFGFVYCVYNDIQFDYWCILDDDIEFIAESENIIDLLYESYIEHGFSTMAFQSSSHKHVDATGKYKIAQWIDGHNIFSRFEDNFLFGVSDSLLTAQNSAYVEVEYQHRLRYFTGQPTVVNLSGIKMLHHTRLGDTVSKTRETHAWDTMNNGSNFWKTKFHLNTTLNPASHGFSWEDVYNMTTQPDRVDYYKQHLIFDGMWNNWHDIYIAQGKHIQEVLRLLE